MTLKNILCIRPDNMGDLLMSSPAISALKATFGCTITVLTSKMGAVIAEHIPDIDHCIVFDAPWVKAGSTDAFEQLVEELRTLQFDAAVIFTVFSQNPLPAAILAYLAAIPVRLAYCRENPYHLLTHWLPDEEPYTFIRHQVARDLDLVKILGASTPDTHLRLSIPDHWAAVQDVLLQAGVDLDKPWIILHPEVSEVKRQYPYEQWVEAGKEIIASTGYQILVTGKEPEHSLAEEIGAISLAGLLDIPLFVELIRHTELVISVNTGTVHIAAAVGTPVLVLYAMTNPQHTPWMVPHKVLYFDVPEELKSKNEVVRYAMDVMASQLLPMATTENIVLETLSLLAPESSLQQPHPLP
jgi:ADP-heptose:LPS heptosyltransferase